ncbi:MAG TPA: response regulator [Longimicrobiaceae bacterium]|nr:response regulator [Longimicrobiaceae bacterium]
MPRRVLVADDEPAITELMASILAYAGFEVLQAHDGPEALGLALRERPDLAMLDVMMPGLDGRDTCRALRMEGELHGLPVVLFSSADEQDVDWRGAGASAFLQKPFDVRGLPELVSRMLPDGGG